ncbi:hypothetical protein Pan161_35130 [Gimesia algae]|uniref:Uncharacterized protein n=1 Tax=Gimesia algae TaxID=2527971 RepID=A0A517VFT4_9PLAN|nr:hypothetical protein Pan161_35130 [Gimesia algae]
MRAQGIEHWTYGLEAQASGMDRIGAIFQLFTLIL